MVIKRSGHGLTIRLDEDDLRNLSAVRHALDTMIVPGGISTAVDAIRFALSGTARMVREMEEESAFVPTGGENGNNGSG